MKKILIPILAATLAMTSCDRTQTKVEKSGSLQLSVSCPEQDYVVVKSTDTGDFHVLVTKDSNGWVAYDGTAAEIPTIIELPDGNYTIVACTPDIQTSEWGAPKYGATEHFAVEIGKVTSVDVKCALTNMKVSVNCSDTFVSELSEFEISVTSETEGKTVVWNQYNCRSGKPAYFDVAPLIVQVSGMRALDGSTATQLLDITKVNAADHHILNLDARSTGAAEFSAFSISIDDKTNDIDYDVHVPGFEEVPVEGGDTPGGDGGESDNPGGDEEPQISMSWENNPSFEVFPLTEEMDVDLFIHARNGIDTFTIKVESSSLDAVIAAVTSNGTTTMDPINDEGVIGLLDGLALPTGSSIKGATELEFPLSKLLPMILLYQPEIGSDHNFTLSVTDAAGNSFSKTLTFRYYGA